MSEHQMQPSLENCPTLTDVALVVQNGKCLVRENTVLLRSLKTNPAGVFLQG